MFKNLIIIIICFCISILLHYNSIPDPDLDKCPLCYGTRLCRNSTNNITFERCYFNFLNLKNIYYGIYNDVSVVIKKLGSNSELNNLDLKYSNLQFSDSFAGVNVSDLRFNSLLGSFAPKNLSKFVFCRFNDYTETVLNDHLTTLKRHDFNNCTDLQFFIALQFILRLNAEPIILQIFNADNGWPVPIYFGSCGRLAVFQNCGQSLHNFLSDAWLRRIYIAKQLMLIAFNFTFSHPHFSLYFTDLTMDNVAVDSNITLHIIDLENVILVNKNFPHTGNKNFRRIITNQTIHKTQHFPCDGCLIFSAEEICGYDISDHNLYSVCKEFFIYPSTLLHDELHEDYHLQQLITDCVDPSNHEPLARFVAAEKLLDKFEQILTL